MSFGIIHWGGGGLQHTLNQLKYYKIKYAEASSALEKRSSEKEIYEKMKDLDENFEKVYKERVLMFVFKNKIGSGSTIRFLTQEQAEVWSRRIRVTASITGDSNCDIRKGFECFNKLPPYCRSEAKIGAFKKNDRKTPVNKIVSWRTRQASNRRCMCSIFYFFFFFSFNFSLLFCFVFRPRNFSSFCLTLFWWIFIFSININIRKSYINFFFFFSN